MLPVSKFACEGGARIRANMPDMAQADLRRVERAARRAAEAREELRVAMRLAHAAGETMSDIARVAGVSRQRVSQILAERRDSS